MVAALLCIAGLLGPPKLPPMPGQDVPSQPKATSPAAKPSPPAAPAKPATPKPGAPQPTTSKPPAKPVTPPPGEPMPPAPTPEPSATPEDPFQLPDAKAEPPQPEPTARPPASDVPKSDGRAPRREPLRAGEIPGESDRERPQLPPPKRPPFTGIGLFAGAGVSFAVALSEQIVGHVIVKRRCIDPIVEQSAVEDPPEQEAEQIGNAIIQCVPGVLPAIALRVHSDLALLSTIGMAAAGAMLRGQRDAYDHAFKSRSRKDIAKLRWAGVGLIAGGAVMYLVTGPTAWGVLAKCDTGKCASRARIMGFVTRDISAAMIAGGAGMLGYAEAYRKHHESYSRERALSFSPSFGRGFAGASLAGRF